jgi:hypothetical protein
MHMHYVTPLGQKGVGKNVIEFGGTWDVSNACMVKWLDI